MIQRLNIAMISIHSCPLAMLGGKDTGGMNVYVRELAAELAKRGHSIDIYTKAHQPQHGPPINLGQNVRVIHLDTGADEDMPKLAIYDYIHTLAEVAENFRKHNQLQYDLIHSHYWLSGLIGQQLQSLWQVPQAVMFHTLGAIKNNLGIGEPEPELRIESEREVIKSCGRIIASTSEELQALAKLYHASTEKITVIPCGVNLGTFQPIDKQQARRELGLDHQKIILFVGRMDPLKGLEQLLVALTHMDGEKPPTLVVVGGDGQARSQIRAALDMVGELHIEERVKFFGSVAQSRLPLFYSAADVCAIPSYYESFGMVALESLACGTPVVATDVGGMKNIIRNRQTGSILDNNSPRNLAEEISGLIYCEKDDPNIKARRDSIAGFSWAAIADKILQEYYRIISD
jgi:D-inositol-3-phosphate glycosyltransferase